MASVAEQLKSTREALGLSVKDVVEQTNLKTDQVEALEKPQNGPCVAGPGTIGRTCLKLSLIHI